MLGNPDTCSVASAESRNDSEDSMTGSTNGVSDQEANGAVREQRASILIVEDDDEIRSSLEDALSQLGYQTRAEPSAEAALPMLHQYLPDAVVADVRMPGLSGIEFCQRLTGDGPPVPVVLMTAFGDVDMAVDALRAGAFDFITKPIAIEQLTRVLDRAVSLSRTKTGIVRLEDPEVPDGSRHGIMGSSPALHALMERIARVAPTDATVLITGESGTGKELVARAVHGRGPRRAGPFVALSCAAMPFELLEAELFGHRRGAFTGAVEARDGLFQGARGGTLFLDEIGDMPLDLQPKLLRVLEEPRVRPLGGAQEVPVDVRIIAATNRDLEQAVEQGHFREDLLFRLNVHHIQVPPLRERTGDVLELARHFLSRGGKSYQLTQDAERLLCAYSWPGNVRELEHCIVSAAASARYDHITAADLPERVRGQDALAPEQDVNDLISLRELERQHILEVLRSVGGNKALTSRRLGLDRKTLYRKLKEYEEQSNSAAGSSAPAEVSSPSE
jgi:DNA-binding NtrC family response regulator